MSWHRSSLNGWNTLVWLQATAEVWFLYRKSSSDKIIGDASPPTWAVQIRRPWRASTLAVHVVIDRIPVSAEYSAEKLAWTETEYSVSAMPPKPNTSYYLIFRCFEKKMGKKMEENIGIFTILDCSFLRGETFFWRRYNCIYKVGFLMHDLIINSRWQTQTLSKTAWNPLNDEQCLFFV
jgi:hypothetical protein